MYMNIFKVHFLVQSNIRFRHESLNNYYGFFVCESRRGHTAVDRKRG
jgi:hypothetical protein